MSISITRSKVSILGIVAQLLSKVHSKMIMGQFLSSTLNKINTHWMSKVCDKTLK